MCEKEPFTGTQRRMLANSDSFDLIMGLQGDDGPVQVTDSGFRFRGEQLEVLGTTPSRLSPVALTTIELQLSDD